MVGDLSYQPVHAKLEDLQAKALQDRPDYRAAALGVTAAQSQISLAKANGKQDVNATVDYTHTADQNSASFFVNFDLPFFNRNQGEIARTGYALTQAQEMQASASDTVLSDVSDAYEALRSSEEVVQLYTSGYLKQAQDSRDISEYAYKRGATSLLDFLDAERSNRAIQLGLSPGFVVVHDRARAAQRSRGNKESSVSICTRSHASPVCADNHHHIGATARRLQPHAAGQSRKESRG